MPNLKFKIDRPPRIRSGYPPPMELRRMIRQSGLTLKAIAKGARVPYQPLQRWMQGVTVKYSVASADRVRRYLERRAGV